MQTLPNRGGVTLSSPLRLPMREDRFWKAVFVCTRALPLWRIINNLNNISDFQFGILINVWEEYLRWSCFIQWTPLHHASKWNFCTSSQLSSRRFPGRKWRWTQERGQKVPQGRRQTQQVPWKCLSPALSQKSSCVYMFRKLVLPITVSCPKKMLRVAISWSQAL